MLKQLAAISRSMVFPIAACCLAAAGVAGCSSDAPEDPSVQEGAVRNVEISADNIATLAPGQSLAVDLSPGRVLYHFKFDNLDFKRVNLTFGKGSIPMDAATKDLFARPYTPLQAATHRFTLTSDPSNFTELTQADLDKLHVEGMLFKEKGSDAPRAQAQTVNTCVEQTIYSEVTFTIGDTTYTIPCAHTILVCGGEPACSEVYSYGGHQYLFCDNQETWDDSRANCQKFGMDLLTVNDAAEESWVYTTANQISTQKWWMGYNDRDVEGQFVWASGAPVTYVNWAPGEPNNLGNEDCGQLDRYYPAYGWNDEPCSNHLRHICESK